MSDFDESEDEASGAQEFTVTDAGRLDKVLSDLAGDGVSRSRLKALIVDGQVALNGNICDDASRKVSIGDLISLTIPEAVEALPQPENIPLDVVYEDDDMLVINKAAGMVVHPGAGNQNGTLVSALLYHCGDTLSGIGGVKRPGIVHRLDKDTTGLMVVAKNDRAHNGLAAQLSDRSLSRIYQALVWKEITPIKGTINVPIGRHMQSRVKMSVRSHRMGREAITHYLREEVLHGVISLVTCQLETGRTHQIRVHMQHLGHPLLGDHVYGLPEQEQRSLLNRGLYEDDVKEAVLGFPRQALHAAGIHFVHPVTGEEMEFEADLPDDLAELFSILS
ncbi:MAG: RNA pseudouridine synthase [Micavibrio aeruginosavorus]|uniref:Pseudouridine synthase n=1 Tax=Micavibrio aeruginosavorus TaxID=349221 RepID=A0A2W5PWW3_9BACT|nr:MAG: RNA pseudouridine synthase [Micavibrio aeruginosavorus]